jgi:hypothetical protein
MFYFIRLIPDISGGRFRGTWRVKATDEWFEELEVL